MNRDDQALFAAIGVFVGCLLADAIFGDGIQVDDVRQAAMLALAAGLARAVWRLRRP